MKKLVFIGVSCFILAIMLYSEFYPTRSFSDVVLENVEALSDSEKPDNNPDCYGTGSVDCSMWEDGKVVTIKVERKGVLSRAKIRY